MTLSHFHLPNTPCALISNCLFVRNLWENILDPMCFYLFDVFWANHSKWWTSELNSRIRKWRRNTWLLGNMLIWLLKEMWKQPFLFLQRVKCFHYSWTKHSLTWWRLGILWPWLPGSWITNHCLSRKKQYITPPKMRKVLLSLSNTSIHCIAEISTKVSMLTR